MNILHHSPIKQVSGDILVVEDSPASMKLLVSILINAGYKARPALDGKLALRSVEVSKPDLILLDFQLPGINGIEVCQRLKSNPETQDIPVIFISSISSSELKVKSLGAGAVDYVTKPIDPPEVLARIASHLGQYRLQKIMEEQAAELEMHRKSLEELVALRTAELKNSEEKFRNMFQTSMDGIMVLSAETGKLTDVNLACEKLYGYSREEFFELKLSDISHEVEISQKAIDAAMVEDLSFIPHRLHIKKDGTVFPIEASTGNFTVGGKKFIYAIIRDITSRIDSEAKIMASLKEKEVLLREIHHRVKNNMQVIVSLLRLQSRRTEDPQVLSVFGECRDRVNAMALIHEALYESRNIAEIDFGSYLKKLARYMHQAYCPTGQDIETVITPSEVWLQMDQGIAVGMVVSELISNAYKHAFTCDRKGRVLIQLHRLNGQEIELIVEDNGVGLPVEVDIHNPESLGLDLAISAVTEELGGTIRAERDNGTKYIIRFECRVLNGAETS